MGKPTGFLEYERTEARSVEPKERIKNYKEFHVFLSKEKQQEQAARCCLLYTSAYPFPHHNCMRSTV